MRNDILVRIVTPSYVAGVILRDGIVVDAAPIVRWALGFTSDMLYLYVKVMGWEAEEVEHANGVAVLRVPQ